MLDAAKRAYCQHTGEPPDRAYFSRTLEHATERHLPRIVELLTEAGFAKQQVVKGRPRRMADETWAAYRAAAEGLDVPIVGLIRAALLLLAQEQQGPAGETQQAQDGQQ